MDNGYTQETKTLFNKKEKNESKTKHVKQVEKKSKISFKSKYTSTY